MPGDVIRVVFGPKAAEYITRQLNGGMHLSKHLLARRTNIEHVWAFIDNQPSDESLTAFDSGGIGGREASQLALAEFILQYLAGTSDSFAIFEDTLARKGDAVLASPTVPYFTFSDEVYYFVQGDQHDIQDISKLLSTAHTYRLLGVLGKGLKITTGGVDDWLLSSIVASADHVLVGAWDAEGELVWSLTESGQPASVPLEH